MQGQFPTSEKRAKSPSWETEKARERGRREYREIERTKEERSPRDLKLTHGACCLHTPQGWQWRLDSCPGELPSWSPSLGLLAALGAVDYFIPLYSSSSWLLKHFSPCVSDSFPFFSFPWGLSFLHDFCDAGVSPIRPQALVSFSYL